MSFIAGIVLGGVIVMAIGISGFRLLRLACDRFIVKYNALEQCLTAIERGDACRRCGYPLLGLELPRCPECGVMKCFDATLEELGLSEEELRLLAAKQPRKESLGSPSSNE